MPRSKRAGGISTFSFEVPSAEEGCTYEDCYLRVGVFFFLKKKWDMTIGDRGR